MGKGKKPVMKAKQPVTAKDETAVIEEETPWWKIHKYEESKHNGWRCLGCGKMIQVIFLTTPRKIRMCRSCGKSVLEGRKSQLADGKKMLGPGEGKQVQRALTAIKKSLEGLQNVNRIKTG